MEFLVRHIRALELLRVLFHQVLLFLLFVADVRLDCLERRDRVQGLLS